MNRTLVSVAVLAVLGCSSANGVSGGPSATFSPVFAGFSTQNGSCACGGPTPYEGIIVLVSDDPNLQAECASGTIQFDWRHRHYLVLELVSAGPLSPGVYPIGAAAPGRALVYEDRPGETNQAASAVTEDFSSGGSVEIDRLGSVIQGSFEASQLGESDGSGDVGNLSGQFAATSCEPVVRAFWQSPCADCSG